MTWSSGLRYIGQFRHNQRHNVKGKMWFGNNESYTGYWTNNQMHGK
jgi:hypothetical protein